MPRRATAALLAAAAASAAAAPNIVMIVADDLGWAELGFQNASKGLQTPNLDAMRDGGARLTRYYTAPLCSPSRGALMTGMYPFRLGLQANVVYWDTPWAPNATLAFLPAVLKASAGYGRTGMFGKWHLGMHRQEAYPTARGFDEFEGYLQGCGSPGTHVASCCAAPPGQGALNTTGFVCPAPSNGGEDFRGYDWFTGTTADTAANRTRSTDIVAARAEAFLARSAGERAGAPGGAPPFFLYLPFQNIHAPYDCAPESYARFAGLGLSVEQAVIYGYIYELDAAVGRVVAALRAGGLLNDTVIVFVSDNGAPAEPSVLGRNYPLRGYKAQVWEGGTRVPALVVGPNQGVVPGATVDALMHVTDWAPTLLAAAGVADPASAMGHPLDGVNMWPLLAQAAAGAAAVGAQPPPPPRADVVVNINPLCAGGQFGAPKAALIAGDLKLVCWCYAVVGIDNATRTGCVGDPAAPPGTWPQLFNLTADPGEQVNLAPAQPAAVAALEARLAGYAAGSVEPMQWVPPFQGPGYACAACPRHPPGGDPAAPWEAWL